MFMIILHHIMVHCFYPQLTNATYISFFNNGVFNYPIFFKKLLIPETFSPLGKTADGIFLIISGYFCVERENRINVFKLTKKLLLQLIFATVFLIVVSIIMFPNQSVENRIGVIISIKSFNDNWWFVGYYFIIVVIGAVFLNKKVSSLDKDRYITLLIVIFAFLSFSYTGVLIDALAVGLRTLCAGIFCYLWGGFCKKYNPLKSVRLFTLFLCVFMIFIIVWITYYSSTIVKIDSYLKGDQSSPFIQLYGINYYADYNILPISLAVIIFEFFRRIKIPSNVVINYIASSCFMVYLIHENDFVREFWRYKDDLVSLLYFSPIKFCIRVVARAIITFAVGLFSYSIFQCVLLLLSKMSFVFLKKHENLK